MRREDHHKNSILQAKKLKSAAGVMKLVLQAMLAAVSMNVRILPRKRTAWAAGLPGTRAASYPSIVAVAGLGFVKDTLSGYRI